MANEELTQKFSELYDRLNNLTKVKEDEVTRSRVKEIVKEEVSRKLDEISRTEGVDTATEGVNTAEAAEESAQIALEDLNEDQLAYIMTEATPEELAALGEVMSEEDQLALIETAKEIASELQEEQESSDVSSEEEGSSEEEEEAEETAARSFPGMEAELSRHVLSLAQVAESQAAELEEVKKKNEELRRDYDRLVGALSNTPGVAVPALAQGETKESPESKYLDPNRHPIDNLAAYFKDVFGGK